MEIAYTLVGFILAIPVVGGYCCWALRGGRSFKSNVLRVMGGQDLGGPDGNNPPPPRP